LAQRSLEIAPNSVLGYQALNLIYWLKNDVPESLQAAEKGLALNPNSAELMADLGLRYSMRGDWKRGLPLVEASYARDPGQPSTYHLAYFLHDYATGKYEDALAEARMLDFPDVIYSHMALAISYAQLGRQQEARAAVRAILSIDPSYCDHAVQDLKKRNVGPELLSLVLDGLKKAGLAIKDFAPSNGSNDDRSQ
jgi:adenylate cyclase